MTALSIAQNVAMKIGVERPETLFSATTRTAREMQAMLNECAAMIAIDSGHDWTVLKTLATLIGDGVSLSFSFPAGYERMLKKARMWPTASPYSPLTHIADTDQWLGTQVQDFSPVVGAWTIIGDEILVRIGGATGPLALADSVQFYYVSNYYAKNAGGTAQAAFTADTDTFRLNERVLERAFEYRWKQDKGQDYAEAMSDYQDALAAQIGKDKGSNILIVGRQTMPLDAVLAFPRAII